MIIKEKIFAIFLRKVRLVPTKQLKFSKKNRVTVYQYFKSKNLSQEVASNILTSFKVDEKDIWGVEVHRVDAIPTRVADPYGFEATKDKFYKLPDDSQIMQVPLITQRAYAGYLVGFSDPEFYDDLETIPPSC
ncbi:hypothetical protein EA772_10280 [Pedobacter sp. G11]|uniref:hypothetical protein n=1 Tax=Pedobacter sp. G11 TaxID=2482728 RepID=UPI000F5E7B43|nr:hypothetical protein [Pedobacter sp. G11]AZI25713.1 hypothetical protein EA772_10280 [Pedobacter sp. G11]